MNYFMVITLFAYSKTQFLSPSNFIRKEEKKKAIFFIRCFQSILLLWSLIKNLSIQQFLCNLQDEELITECLNPSTAQAKEFKLYNRAKHVYSEANRVLRYKDVCASNAEDKIKVSFLKTQITHNSINHYVITFLKLSFTLKQITMQLF